jgi:hypothetical protein
MARDDLRRLTAHSPAGNAAGEYGQPGIVREHHPPGCSCRPCRRLRAAERRRQRRQITRQVTGD